MSIANLLNKVLIDDYTPTDDEMQMIGEIKGEIKDFVDHWDEARNKPSPFLYINVLNKLASLNFVYEGVDLAKMSSLLKNIHGERYGFTASILDRDSNGHFTTRVNTGDQRDRSLIFFFIKTCEKHYLYVSLQRFCRIIKFSNVVAGTGIWV